MGVYTAYPSLCVCVSFWGVLFLFWGSGVWFWWGGRGGDFKKISKRK